MALVSRRRPLPRRSLPTHSILRHFRFCPCFSTITDQRNGVLRLYLGSVDGMKDDRIEHKDGIARKIEPKATTFTTQRAK